MQRLASAIGRAVAKGRFAVLLQSAASRPLHGIVVSDRLAINPTSTIQADFASRSFRARWTQRGPRPAKQTRTLQHWADPDASLLPRNSSELTEAARFVAKASALAECSDALRFVHLRVGLLNKRFRRCMLAWAGLRIANADVGPKFLFLQISLNSTFPFLLGTR